jgi:serine protease Do
MNLVRDILPQLRTGQIPRGRIGVGVRPVDRDAIDELGLKERAGALVSTVSEGSAAARAGLEPGDVILSYNGKAVKNSNELVQMVTATKPGTSVPLRIVRDKQERTVNITVDELDLEAESGRTASARGGRDAAPEPATTRGFGMTVENVTPELARRMRLDIERGAVITDVEQGSPAARFGLRPGDVIVRVGGSTVNSAADAQRELGRVPSGGTALIRIVRGGQQIFVTVTKE